VETIESPAVPRVDAAIGDPKLLAEGFDGPGERLWHRDDNGSDVAGDIIGDIGWRHLVCRRTWLAVFELRQACVLSRRQTRNPATAVRPSSIARSGR